MGMRFYKKQNKNEYRISGERWRRNTDTARVLTVSGHSVVSVAGPVRAVRARCVRCVRCVRVARSGGAARLQHARGRGRRRRRAALRLRPRPQPPCRLSLGTNIRRATGRA